MKNLRGNFNTDDVITRFNNLMNETINLNDRLFQIGFGAPYNVRFNTPYTKDMNPAYWSVWEEDNLVEGEDDYGDNGENHVIKERVGYKAICRTIGIREEDIKLELRNYGLCLDGTTDIGENRYSQHIELPISREVMKNIEEITYECRDGLTYIYLRMKKEYPREVPILLKKNTKDALQEISDSWNSFSENEKDKISKVIAGNR